MSILVNRPDNKRRPADWRWQRAGELANGSRLIAGRDDSIVRELTKFRRLLDRCETDEDRLAALDADPVLFSAYLIYDANETPTETRWELEARLLARESFESIGQKIHEDVDVIKRYEEAFFDVMSRIDHPGLITHIIVGKAVQTGLAERQYDLLWKLFGYHCGPLVLDAFIYKFNAPTRPETPSQVSAHWGDDTKEVIKVKANVAARTIQINGYTAEGILNMFHNMAALEQQAGAAGGGSELMAENVQAMQNCIPWIKYIEGVSPKMIGRSTEFEKDGMTLRSHELMMLSMGIEPEGLEYLTTDIGYPDGDDQNAKAHEGE